MYVTGGATSVGNYTQWATGTANTGSGISGTTGATSTGTINLSDHLYAKYSPISGIELLSGAIIKKLDDDSCEIELPDGTILTIDELGNFQVNDKNAKVIYLSNSIREFNQYINASDLLEEFIKFLGKEFDIRQNQIMDVPIQVFIEWLIVQAAIKDGDDYSRDMQMLKIEAQKERNWYRRCKCCGRYIQKRMFDAGLLFCNSICFDKYQLRLN